MENLFSKPITEIDKTDIDWLLDHGPCESPTVEYKSALSETGEDPDTWTSTTSPYKSIGNRAKERIIKEVIAFANSGGGTLVIGVSETEDDPPRPKAVNPIAHCGDLATHLTDVLRDGIDPTLPTSNIQAIPIQGDAGLVLIRVQASWRAPHRCRRTLRVFKRFGDQSIPIDMREIQDLVILTSSGASRLDDVFENAKQQCSRELGEQFPHSNQPGHYQAIFIRPVFELKLERLSEKIPHAISPQKSSVRLLGETDSEQRLRVGASHTNFRPIVRGHLYSKLDGDEWTQISVHQSGLVEYRYRSDADTLPNTSQLGLVIRPALLFGHLMNAILIAHTLRQFAGQPELELALEFVISNDSYGKHTQKVTTIWDGHQFSAFEKWTIIDDFPVFPRYSIGSIEELPFLLTTIHRDYWDGVGKSFEYDLSIDPAEMEKQLNFAT